MSVPLKTNVGKSSPNFSVDSCETVALHRVGAGFEAYDAFDL